MRCPSCGGVIGRDCFNPVECAWITQSMDAQYAVEDYKRHQQDIIERQHYDKIELEYQAYVEAQYREYLIDTASVVNPIINRFLQVI